MVENERSRPSSRGSRRARWLIAGLGLAAGLVLYVPAAAIADPLAPKPPPYSLAWQLRPATVGNVFRSDTSFAGYDDDTSNGLTIASTFLASYKVTPTLAPLIRFAVSRNNPPTGETAVAASNPLLGATWAPVIAPPFKVAVLGAVTLPLGSGGGDTPDAARLAANRSAVLARSCMDNALFAVNDLAVIAGGDVAYVADGLTVQAEITLFELFRMRGANAQPDSTKTNFTSGIHAGYFVAPWASIGAEVRYQRWLSTPKAVADDMTGTLRDSLSAAIGARFHVKLGGKKWLRPGIAYARGLDDPMSNRSYNVIQVDVPFVY